MNRYDYLIVGAGLFGSVFAYKAKQNGKRCLVIDKRSHIGGNIYCENKNGINIHKYGAHIFHTSNKDVWNFVNSFVEFNRYTNSPIANFEGKIYNLPFNMNTFHQMWGVVSPSEAQQKIEEQKKEAIAKMVQEGIEQPRNLEEQALALVGKDIYDKLIKGYTEKQWGRKCSELPAFIIKRLPLRMTYDNNYFNDKYQGIPIGGYNILIEKLLTDVDIRLNCDFFSNRDELTSLADTIVYTGAIDEYYEYRYGKLEYRTITFEEEILDTSNFQGNAVVNYTCSSIPYTRIIEHKHFETFGDDIFKNKQTIISKEYSSEWEEGSEPYYPINDLKNNNLYYKYKQLANNEKNIIFGGRLAEYKYYDMHNIIEKVLDLFENKKFNS